MLALISSSRVWWLLPIALVACDGSDAGTKTDAGNTTDSGTVTPPSGTYCYVALSKAGASISIDELTVAGPKKVKAPGTGLTLVAQDGNGAELQQVEFGFTVTVHGIGRDDRGNVTAEPSEVELTALELPLDDCDRIGKLIVTDGSNAVLAEKSF
ncbi:MAG: hypothetical protein JRI68_13825 [Deltaproteobacteria bacterium]|nr:hypothetical protein [Deltaproteobacteria bacterium]